MPPATRRDDVIETLHGRRVADPYRWLEDEHAPEVQAWMDAQDAYAREVLGALPGRERFAARLRELFYFDAIGAPLHRGGRHFYSRKHKDREKTVVYWRDERGEERVLFDPNTWSADGSVGLGGWWPSWDGARVAYAVKQHNSDETITRVRDVARGEDLPDELAGTKYAAMSWTPDDRGFYYTYVPPVGGEVTVAERPGFAELRFHALGTAQAADPVVRGATRDPQTFLGGGISREGDWLLAFVQHGWNATDVYFKDARVPGAPWQTLVAGVHANFAVDVWRGAFYVTTNDGAPRYRVFKVDPARPERAAWREIVAESDGTLESASVVGEHLVLSYLRRAASELEVHDLDGRLVHAIALPPLGTAAGLTGNPDEDTAYISFTSFTEPQIVFETSIRTGAVTPWARVDLPVETARLVTHQVSYASKDGTPITMFLLHRDDVRPTGDRPTILYGYGGFNVSLTPAFAGSRVAWLERGGVYAIPNLRGGGEYGEAWHQAGMLGAKQNVFDDFIAAAEHLIASGWTSPAHLAISGGSNGGLLVGAALAQRPELMNTVICAVPLLDMLRYHRFGSGATWVPEYGSPDDPALFEALWAYSPYRVAVDAGPRAYPAVLLDSADHDDRVDPMHARKLAAALQAQQAGDAPILLRIERNAGHGGADMVKQQVDRIADQLALLAARLGLPV